MLGEWNQFTEGIVNCPGYDWPPAALTKAMAAVSASDPFSWENPPGPDPGSRRPVDSSCSQSTSTYPGKTCDRRTESAARPEELPRRLAGLCLICLHEHAMTTALHARGRSLIPTQPSGIDLTPTVRASEGSSPMPLATCGKSSSRFR